MHLSVKHDAEAKLRETGWTMELPSTLDRGAALLLEQRLEQQRLRLMEARVPPEIVQDSEMLEKSLSSLRVSLRAEKLESELEAAIEVKDQLRAENRSLNGKITSMAVSLRQVRIPHTSRTVA